MADHPITAHTQVSALGHGNQATLVALQEGRTGLRAWQAGDGLLQTHIAEVAGWQEQGLPGGLAQYDCRNNRLLELALQQDGFTDAVAAACRRHGADRLGIFIGTSTSGIAITEQAYRESAGRGDAGPLPADRHSHRHTHQTYSAARYLRERLALAGPAQVVSTACSSSAKVFAAAHRFLEAGLIDAAIVGGVDSLCETTLYGFHSLQLVSADPCRPWDRDRSGINIGEAAGLALIERRHDHAAYRLLGYGESSDAYHMSSPEPEGRYAAEAMHAALHRAGLRPEDIDLVNLHATATRNNDRAEDRAIQHIFPADAATCFVATKGLTGHTLGAAGIIESLFCLLSLEQGFVPASAGLQTPDPVLVTPLNRAHRRLRPRHAMNNSFGFGGSNACLIFGERDG